MFIFTFFWNQYFFFVPKADKDKIKGKLLINFLMNVDSELLSKTFENHVLKFIKKIIYHEAVLIKGMQGWFNLHKSMQCNM